VELIGIEGGTTLEGKQGVKLTTDQAAEDLVADDLDILVIAGGFGPDKLRTDEGVKSLVRGMDEQGKPIAFICHAGWVPISAGIVAGRRVTSVPAIADDLRNAGAEWEDAEVVVDGNFVTSRRPPDLPAFMRALIGVAVDAADPIAAG
jgi:protease I